MFPILSVIVAVTLGLVYRLEDGPPAPDVLGTAAVLLLYAAAAGYLYDSAVRRSRARAESAVLSLLRVAMPVRVGAVVAYGIIVYVFDWPEVVRVLGVTDWILVDEILILLPYGVLLVLSFLASWSGESRLEVHDFSLGEYILFHCRQYLLPVAPILAFLLFHDSILAATNMGIEWAAEAWFHYRTYPFVQWLTVIGLLFLLYCLVPFLLRLLWRAKPLPAGPVRERLEEFSRREGFRAREILVWPTGRNVMNAAVIGVAGPVRYVLVTDALLETLELDEVEAVFAHEVGHAKHQHMLLFILFTLGFVLLSFLLNWTLGPTLNSLLGTSTFAFIAYSIGAFLLYFGMLFGFVSRRFEQQADVYGAESLSRVRGEDGPDAPPGEHPFVRALERLAEQFGDIREVKGWRHFSLSERIAFLTRYLVDPAVRKRYRRRVAVLFLAFFGLLATLCVGAAATIPDQIREGRAQVANLRASWLFEQGRDAEGTAERIRAYEMRGIHVVDPVEVALRALAISRSTDLRPEIRADALLRLSAAYWALGEHEAARDALEDFWRTVGDRPDVLALLGDLYEKDGRLRAARMAFADAFAGLSPDAAAAAKVRARIEEIDTRSGAGSKR